jgi:TPR repeat protein
MFMQSRQFTACINEIESSEKASASLAGQMAVINSMLALRQNALTRLTDSRADMFDHAGHLKRGEHKKGGQLPELDAKIEELKAEIEDFQNKATALTQLEKEIRGKLWQLRQEKETLMQSEEENRRLEEDAEKSRLLAEEKLKKEEILLSEANNGDKTAQYNLGMWYLNEKKEAREASEWLLKAADNGDTESLYELG